MNKYKCEEHKLDLACLGCVKALVARHDRMLEFIRRLIKRSSPTGRRSSDIKSLRGESVLKEMGLDDE